MLSGSKPSVRRAFAAALTLLMLWSTGVLAAWCGDPDSHWAHPGADQAWVKSSVAEIHKHRERCSTASALSLVTLPVTSHGEDDEWSPGSSNPFLTAAAEWPSVMPDAIAFQSMASGTMASPRLYLIYQKLLLPFPS